MVRGFVLICSLAFLGISSCNYKSVEGNGHMATKSYPESGFHDLDISSSFKVYLVQGSNYSIKIDAEENLLDKIMVHKEGDKLVIGFKENIAAEPTKAMIINITAPEFRDIELSGASTLISQQMITAQRKVRLELRGACETDLYFDAQTIEVNAKGASKIALKGKTKDFAVRASGSSVIHCFDLITDNTTLNISGGGDAEVNVSQLLKVKISGAGDVQYKGTPQTIKQEISGAGAINKWSE